jgi:hypothetical protein
MHLRAAAATQRALESESPCSIGETVEKIKIAVSVASIYLIRVRMLNQSQSGFRGERLDESAPSAGSVPAA